MSRYTRAEIKTRADEAADAMRQHHTGEKQLTAGEVVCCLADLGSEAEAAWSAYHRALAACPVVVTPAELAALYQAVADAMAALTLATWGRHDQTRSEGGTEPTVPEPVEPALSGAGVTEHLS